MAEVRAIADEPLADLDIEFEDIDFRNMLERADTVGPSTLPKAKPPGATVKISLRVPTRTLMVLKDRAAETGFKYQTIINEQLRKAVERSRAE